MREKKCICRNPACKGLSAGFALLGDPRGGFVRLPRFVPTHGTSERNGRRAAYLRHLLPNHGHSDTDDDDTRTMAGGDHVALHHFHPRIVADLTPQRRFPKSISEYDMDELGMIKQDEDRVLDSDGSPTGFYVFVPSYPIEDAKNDIKRLLGICKTINTTNTASDKKKRKHGVHQFAMDLTNASDESNDYNNTSLEDISPTPGPGAVAFVDSDSEEEENAADSINGKKYLPWHLLKQHHTSPAILSSSSSSRLAEF